MRGDGFEINDLSYSVVSTEDYDFLLETNPIQGGWFSDGAFDTNLDQFQIGTTGFTEITITGGVLDFNVTVSLGIFGEVTFSETIEHEIGKPFTTQVVSWHELTGGIIPLPSPGSYSLELFSNFEWREYNSGDTANISSQYAALTVVPEPSTTASALTATLFFVGRRRSAHPTEEKATR